LTNVTEDGLRVFIERFHQVLDETASANLDADSKARLLHASLLPARIIGYVSTQLGVAIEYEAASKTSINVIRGSARVEDLLVRAPRALQGVGPMIRIGGANWRCIGSTLEGAFPFRLSQPDASVLFTDVEFRAGPWVRTIAFAEVWANRTAEHWTADRAALRAKDEVLVALVEVARAHQRNLSVGEYIAEFKNKTVLVLGAYDEAGTARLNAIAEALTGIGYAPLLMRDVPDHPHHDLAQKVAAVGAISRFVVIDDTAKSGHLMEAQICKQNGWVTALVRAKGEFSSWMTAAFSASSRVILETEYDPSEPLQTITRVTEWAEATLKQLEQKFTNTYPWRKGGY
jgi:hypothetical protein